MSVFMISLIDHLYGGRRLKAGEQFYARGQGDAKLLAALRRAVPDFSAAVVPALLVTARPAAPAPVHEVVAAVEVAESPAPVADQIIEDVMVQLRTEIDAKIEALSDAPAETRDMTAEESPATEETPQTETVRTKRAYRRRDMQAE